MKTYKWKDIKRKVFYFDFGPEKGTIKIALKSDLDAFESLKVKLHEIDSKTNWNAFKLDLKPLRKK